MLDYEFFYNTDFYDGLYNMNDLDNQNEPETGQKMLRLTDTSLFFGLQDKPINPLIYGFNGFLVSSIDPIFNLK